MIPCFFPGLLIREPGGCGDKMNSGSMQICLFFHSKRYLILLMICHTLILNAGKFLLSDPKHAISGRLDILRKQAGNEHGRVIEVFYKQKEISFGPTIKRA